MEKELDEMTPEELRRLFPIKICDYDPAWAKLFEVEKDHIINALDANCILGIHHIGSTAVPEIPAKPTIDILLQIQSGADLNDLSVAMEKLGYFFSPQPGKPAPHMMFMKGYSKSGYTGQAFHVHVRYQGEPDELYFRDFLITHPDIAQEYGALKRRLQSEFQFDRDGYTDAKTEFVLRITQNAKELLFFTKKEK